MSKKKASRSAGNFLRRIKGNNAGYSLIIVVIAVNVFAILLLMARSMWETELTRDLEAELLFRARQYANAIELYTKKHNNTYPPDLDTLYAENFLRKQYPDPMTELGEWNLVLKSTAAGQKGMLIVPLALMDKYSDKGAIIGVASASTEEGFRMYRKKKKYCEWAVYVGDDPEKDMPDLKFVDESGKVTEVKGSGDKEGGRRGDTDNKGRESSAPPPKNVEVRDNTAKLGKE